MIVGFLIVILGGILNILLAALVSAVVIGYLLGSLPFGLIFTRLAGLGDVRQIGSGNIGATNVLRTGNKKIAAATLLADMLKGTLAAAIFTSFDGDSTTLNGDGITITLAPIAAFFALLGHIFPLWLNFKGGKGVATYLGALLILSPWGALAFVTLWLACAVLSHYSSLSALVSVIVVGAAGLWLDGGFTSITIALMSFIIIAKHYTNIKRLMAGTESKINLSRK